MKPYKIVSRKNGECVHDTGVCHSVQGGTCDEAEEMADFMHLHEDDPLHQVTWHQDDAGNPIDFDTSRPTVYDHTSMFRRVQKP